MNIYLDKVTENQKDILYRLLQYSLYEESLYDGNEMNERAIFDYKYFDKYFTDTNRDAYIVKEENTNKILGFVMINQYMQRYEYGHSIAEFMIVPSFRRKHIGQEVAIKSFEMYKGNWEISPAIGSKEAFEFWNKVISQYIGDKFEYDNGIFMFNNKKII